MVIKTGSCSYLSKQRVEVEEVGKELSKRTKKEQKEQRVSIGRGGGGSGSAQRERRTGKYFFRNFQHNTGQVLQ